MGDKTARNPQKRRKTCLEMMQEDVNEIRREIWTVRWSSSTALMSIEFCASLVVSSLISGQRSVTNIEQVP